MSNYRAGDIIRMTREFVGMSREELRTVRGTKTF